jgi:hypothetical protein
MHCVKKQDLSMLLLAESGIAYKANPGRETPYGSFSPLSSLPRARHWELIIFQEYHAADRMTAGATARCAQMGARTPANTDFQPHRESDASAADRARQFLGFYFSNPGKHPHDDVDYV